MAEFDEKLIGCVKEYPCLYNTKLSDFIKKENAWSAVAKSMNCSGKQYISSNACVCVCVCVCVKGCVIMYVTVSIVELVQKRWKNLRERYTKEHKKKKKQTGDSADEEKEWEFYKLMNFLRDFIRHRK